MTAAPLEKVGLKVDFEDGQAVESFVVSWYVTAGTLEPQRTLGSEVATLEMPEEGEVEVIAVVRESGGGTGWARTVLRVTLRSNRRAAMSGDSFIRR